MSSASIFHLVNSEKTEIVQNTIWTNLMQTAIPRFNMVDGAAVNKLFFEFARFIGKGWYDTIMHIIYDKNEIKAAKWYWKYINIPYPKYVYVFRGDISQHLRFTRRRSIHNETWIFGAFKCNDKIYRLCPLKRDSDFDYDIFQKLEDNTIQNVYLPFLHDSETKSEKETELI
jgi:hypothetical protein